MNFVNSLLTTLISILVFFNAGKVKEPKSRLTVQVIASLIGTIAVIAAILRTLIVIPTGSIGVEDFQGQVSARTLAPGFHLVNPFAEVVTFSTRLRDVKETIEATSKEGLAFNIDVSLQYKLEPQQAVAVYRAIGTDETEIVISRFRATVREITANYPAKAIYSSQRQEIASRLGQRLSEQLTPLGFVVESALLREIKIPETLQTAIQQKLKAEQESQEMTFVLEKQRQESERKRIEAKGIADSQKTISQGLTPQILQLRAIEATEKLSQSSNSKVVVVGGGQEGLPVMLQLVDTPRPKGNGDS